MRYVSRLYLGRAIPEGAMVGGIVSGTGRTVPAEAFDDFVNNVVATTFPDGFTLIPVNGGWRDVANGTTIKEPSTILEVYHTGSAAVRHKVRDVAVTYRQRFGQDAVMVSTQPLHEEVQFL